MTASLTSGLVSGIIVALLVVVFRSFWDQILIPWFEERVYKDARIEGKWFSLYPTTEENRQEVITLSRHGHTVTGTMICTVGEDEGEQYQLSGSFRNLILPLVYETHSRSKTDRGTLTLKLMGNGQELRGKLASYFTPTDDVETADVIWFRSRADLERLLLAIGEREDELQAIRLRERESDAAKRKLTETPNQAPMVVQKENHKSHNQ